jgi:hypothetical protein
MHRQRAPASASNGIEIPDILSRTIMAMASLSRSFSK